MAIFALPISVNKLVTAYTCYYSNNFYGFDYCRDVFNE